MAVYKFDRGQSRFTVQAFATGMLSAMAHNPTFAIREFIGEIHFDPSTTEKRSFQIAVEAKSLQLTDSVSAKDRQEIERLTQHDVLESATYPQVVFQSTKISATQVAENWHRLQIFGTLNLHGVKQDHEVDAQLRLNGDRLRLSGDTTLRLSDYRLKRISALAGTIKLKDELKFLFELIAAREGA